MLSLSHCPRFGISEVIRRFFELACAACILTLSAHTAKAQPRRLATLTPEQRLAARRERAVASGPKQYSVPADLNLTSAIDKHDVEVHKDHADGASRRITHQSGMYFSIPEYHDEQHLQVSNTAFGPLAYFYASPFLGSFTRLSQLREQGTYGAFAALIEVEAPATAGALPPPYTRLGLQVGHSCMWLANASAAEGWKAYVTPITAATRECDRPTGIPAPTELKLVNRFTDTQFTFTDYPPVARFSEAAFVGSNTFGQPLLGVKCLDGWCEFGPKLSEVQAKRPMADTLGKFGAIPGWSDEQALIIQTGASLSPTVRASLVPDGKLEGYRLVDFAITDTTGNPNGGWLSVATILLDTDPPNPSKYWDWGLRKGENYLFLRRIMPGTGANDWQMSIVRSGADRFVWKNVTREPHTDVHVPGTARWRFASWDPIGVWVKCGEACCYGDGGGH